MCLCFLIRVTYVLSVAANTSADVAANTSARNFYYVDNVRHNCSNPPDSKNVQCHHDVQQRVIQHITPSLSSLTLQVLMVLCKWIQDPPQKKAHHATCRQPQPTYPQPLPQRQHLCVAREQQCLRETAEQIIRFSVLPLKTNKDHEDVTHPWHSVLQHPACRTVRLPLTGFSQPLSDCYPNLSYINT